jgi:hypothetical protein
MSSGRFQPIRKATMTHRSMRIGIPVYFLAQSSSLKLRSAKTDAVGDEVVAPDVPTNLRRTIGFNGLRGGTESDPTANLTKDIQHERTEE